MAETVSAIVTAALRLLKVSQSGETISASEAEDGRIAINDILEEWSLDPLMHTGKTQLTQVLTTSASYTFGTGGDNSTRPIAIHSAFIRDSGNIDHPVNILMNEEFNFIPSKTVTSSIPNSLYYRNSYPLGVVTLYPKPSSAYTLYLQCQTPFATYSTVSASVNLAPSYLKALKYALAIALSPEYKEPSQVVIMEAEASKSRIKRMNTKDKPVMQNLARQAVRSGHGSDLFYRLP